MERPGCVIYFEMADAMRQLSLADRGRLITAILDYAQLGVVPELPGKTLPLLWQLLKPRLDRDQESYEKTVKRRQKKTADPVEEQTTPKNPMESYLLQLRDSKRNAIP